MWYVITPSYIGLVSYPTPHISTRPLTALVSDIDNEISVLEITPHTGTRRGELRWGRGSGQAKLLLCNNARYLPVSGCHGTSTFRYRLGFFLRTACYDAIKHLPLLCFFTPPAPLPALSLLLDTNSARL